MKLPFVRVLTITIAAAALAACANSNAIVPISAEHNARMPVTAALKPTGNSSPCNPPDQFFYFRGACKAYAMRPAFTKVALSAYHGITFTEIWPGDNPAKSNNSWVTGDAVGNGDITGVYRSGPFPLYGTTLCLDKTSTRTRCIGKAFLYTVTANASSYDIGFNHGPKVIVTNTNAYPGKTCQPISLVYSDQKQRWFWQIWPTQGKPVGNTLTIPYWDDPIAFGPGSVLMLGIMCY